MKAHGAVQKAILILPLLLSGARAYCQTADDFFDPNVLHDIRIDINPSDWQTLKANFEENTHYPADFHWIYGGRDLLVEQVSVRSRGLGSRTPVKPGLTVQFDRFTDRTFAGLRSVVLRNNTLDASMMHEFVSMELMRRMGVPAPREAYARLSVNGEYAGLYTIVEDVDPVFLQRNFGESGGYLYKYEYNAADPPNRFEWRGLDASTYSPAPFKPETHRADPNPWPLVEMVAAINFAGDSYFETALAPFLDLKQFLKEVAVESYLAETDGILADWGMNNFYLYRFTGANRSQFIPWDKDSTFFAVDRSVWVNTNANILMRRALAVPELRAYYIQALLQTAAAAGGVDGWLDREVRRVYSQIADAAHADSNKQCYGDTPVMRTCSNDEFDAAQQWMTEFAQKRAAFATQELLETTTADFSIHNGGALHSTAEGQGLAPVVSSARIEAGPEYAAPAGFALLSLVKANVLVNQTVIPSSRATQAGRIYAEVRDGVTTALAIYNPNDDFATIQFYFTDFSGLDFGYGELTVAPNSQVAGFLNEAPFNQAAPFIATLTFRSSLPVAVQAFRGLVNERSEFLMTALPFADLTNPSTGGLSYLVADGGWATEIVLVNPSEDPASGSLAFWSNGTHREASYAIAPRSFFTLSPPADGDAVQYGAVQISPIQGMPVVFGIASFRQNGVTVTEAGIPAVSPGAAFRMFAETSGDFAHAQLASLETAAAIVNPSEVPVEVFLELTTPSGESTGLLAHTTVAPGSPSVVWLRQIPEFANLPAAFRGVLRISTSSPAGIALTGMRFRCNERGEVLMTTMEPVPEIGAMNVQELFFPYMVEAGGYTSEIVLFSRGQASTGKIRSFSQSGEPLDLRLQNDAP